MWMYNRELNELEEQLKMKIRQLDLIEFSFCLRLIQVKYSTNIKERKMNGEKIDSIDFIPHSRTFTCEEERKPLIIDSKLFKTILNEVKSMGWMG